MEANAANSHKVPDKLDTTYDRTNLKRKHCALANSKEIKEHINNDKYFI